MSCAPTREWLHRDVASLEEAQRLVLDDHLAACDDCRADRERLRLVREVGTSLPVPPAGAREYSRAIARALLAPRGDAPSPAKRWWPWLLAPALGAAIALIVVVRDDAQLARIATPDPEVVVDDRIVDGELFDDTKQLRVGDAVPRQRPLRSTAPARVKLASLDVAIAPDSQLRWHGDHLVLDQGKLEIQAASSTRVITERFEVELVGSASIEPERVHVKAGSARITDRSRTLLAQLEAGSHWQPELEMPPETVPESPRPTKPTKPAADVMSEARTQFAAGNHADAEHAVDALLARKLSRAEEAEARMFLADIAQATGNLDVAVTRYELVATKFADLPAAESALYAAARIEARRGRDARALFDRYLERYPKGRYADDVRQRRH